MTPTSGKERACAAPHCYTLVSPRRVAGLCEAKALYDVKPDEIPGRPGTIIRIWPLEGGGPASARADAFRILYRSTGLKGEPIAVSGAIFVPHGAAPSGGRDVIAWAHPTSGVMPPCAPSLMPDTAGLIWGLDAMLEKGYVVTATDYPGLGTDGIHPYLIGRARVEPCSIPSALRGICQRVAPLTVSPCGVIVKAAKPHSLRASSRSAMHPS